MNDNVSVNDILSNVQAAAYQAGLSLTYTNMKIFFKMIDYIHDIKNKDRVIFDHNGARFNFTTNTFANYCSVSPRMVTDTISKLQICGVIEYTIKKPKPSVIKVLKDFL